MKGNTLEQYLPVVSCPHTNTYTKISITRGTEHNIPLILYKNTKTIGDTTIPAHQDAGRVAVEGIGMLKIMLDSIPRIAARRKIPIK